MAPWCNGSTAVSKTASGGSNPSGVANKVNGLAAWKDTLSVDGALKKSLHRAYGYAGEKDAGQSVLKPDRDHQLMRAASRKDARGCIPMTASEPRLKAESVVAHRGLESLFGSFGDAVRRTLNLGNQSPPKGHGAGIESGPLSPLNSVHRRVNEC